MRTNDAALPEGLKLAYEIMSPDEEATLIALIEAAGLSYHAYDADNPRSSASYGWTYDFRNDSFTPCGDMPDGFRGVRDAAATFAGVEPDDLAECLLNRYEPGAVIQWHFDKPVWKHVIGISLGSPVTMEFRKQVDRGYEYAAAELLPRSMYLLSGEARHAFQHSLPPLTGKRWSITFRSFSEEGRKLRDRMASAA